MERSLERLWDIQEIRELAYRYAFAVDSKDHDGVLSLFVETEQAAPPPAVDIHFFRAAREAFFEKGASTLFVGNHIIDFDGKDTARGNVYCVAMVEMETFFDQAIIYQDDYRRVDGAWKFVKREHLLWWGEERPVNPMTQPPANWPESQIGAGIAAARLWKQ